jgi:predicted enzyme related to lactoylglutathione lyase
MVKASNVSHIIYPVIDLEKSIDFLTNALGFYLQRRGQTTYLGAGETLLELVQVQGSVASYIDAVRRISQPEGAERPTVYLFGVAVDDLDEALKVVEEHGGEVVRPIWNARTFWGRQAVIKDPGGQQIALREWRAPDGPHFQGWQPEGT